MDVDDMGKFCQAWGILESLHSNAPLTFVLVCHHRLDKTCEYLILFEITVDYP